MKFLKTVLSRYIARFVAVFFLNAVTAMLSLFSFLMIEPFLKLLFRGNLDNLSVISALIVSLISKVYPLESLKSSFVIMILGAILLFFFKNLFQYLSQCSMAHIRSHFTYTLRQKLYDKIISLPLGFFNKEKRGDFISRAVSDVQECEYTSMTAIYQWLTEPITLFFYLFFLFYIDYQLTFWALLLFPPTFLVIGWLSHSLRKDSKTAKQRLGRLTSFVEETMIGYKVIAFFNRHDHFNSRYDVLNHSFHDKQRTIYRKSYLASPLSEFLGVSVVMMVLVIGGTLVLSERSSLSAELFITYIAIFSQIINPIKNISSSFAEFKRGEAASDRIDKFLSVKDEIVDSPSAISKTNFNGVFSFENVSFAYLDTLVVKSLSFSVKKGQTIAFVGESGSGKSTVADLLMRFFDPVEGVIKMDGYDVRGIRIRDYRSMFSLVSQDVVLFHDSFRNNITLGRDFSDEEVELAAKSAGIYDFISSFPDGMEHTVGDMGGTVSGGQRQKVSIARAILGNAPIIILDEATSAMDSESERHFQESVRNVFRDKTMVVIAHRLSTIADADCIYVLHDGEIVEAGRHGELMAARGKYFQLTNNNL